MVRFPSHYILVYSFKPIHLAGTEYLDMVTLGPGLTIKDQSIGVAKSVSLMEVLPSMIVNESPLVGRIPFRSRWDPRVRPLSWFF